MEIKCANCGFEIQLNELVYEMRYGKFKYSNTQDDRDGIHFHESISFPIHGYIHANCIESNKEV